MSAPPPPAPHPQTGSAAGAFLYGCRTAATSVFAFVITVTYIGFGALAHDYGFSVGWAMLSTALVWAGPAQVILVTALGSGTALLETAVAVGLSSVRLLPMVVALLPVVKGERSRPWQLVLPAHFWAVSVWVEAMRLAPGIPREHRIAFCNGIGTGLLTAGVLATGAGYYLQAALPALFGAAAMFITPISFLVSTARNARLFLEKMALALGLVIGPLLAFSRIEFDLLWTGVIGGTLAYGAHRLIRLRSAAP
jgi:predicted branched-subunit amino acid permease